MPEQQEPYVVLQADAPRVAEWLVKRGGVQIWDSADPGEPAKRWLTPVLREDGQPVPKPHPEAGKVIRTMTRPEEMVVVEGQEHRRIHVELRSELHDGKRKLTNASAAHLLEGMEAAAELNDNAWYVFDYDTQEAVIYLPSTTISMADWLKSREASAHA